MMQDYKLYEYAIVRLVPKVEREEFINIGVILYCTDFKFLAVSFQVDKLKIKGFDESLDVEELSKNLDSFQAICKGENCGSSIAEMDVSSRFRWLTATRSTILQCSKVHSGFCLNPNYTLQKLMREMVY